MRTDSSWPGAGQGLAGDFFALTHRKVPGLDGLRGLACLMIFNVHFFAQFAAKDYFVQPGSLVHTLLRTLHSGSHGVDVFFVISGFLIYSSIRRTRPGFARFLLMRYARLLPVVLVVNVPALYWIDASWREVVDNIFFLGIFPGSRMVTLVSWALVYEMYFYILCGLWLITLGQGRDGPPWASYAVLFTLYVLNSLVLHQNQVLSDWRFVGFFVGLGLAMLHEDQRTKGLVHKVPAGIWPLCLGLMLLACWLWSKDALGWLSARSPALALGYYAAFDLVVALLVASFLKPKPSSSPFTAKWTRVLGAVSYSLFLSHTQWGLPLAGSLAGLQPFGLAGLGLYYLWSLGLSLALACLLFMYLERFYFIKR